LNDFHPPFLPKIYYSFNLTIKGNGMSSVSKGIPEVLLFGVFIG
jgi:hypothetical protein